LFRFGVPGLNAALAVPIEQLIGVAHLTFVTRVPFAPPTILGLSRWQSAPVVILDLRRVLDPAAPPDDGQEFLGLHHLIVKIAIDNQISLVGCPILGGGQIMNVSMSLPRAAMPAGIVPEMVHQAVLIADTPVLLLDMMRLPALIAPLQPVRER